jgi:hypothetical protein
MKQMLLSFRGSEHCFERTVTGRNIDHNLAVRAVLQNSKLRYSRKKIVRAFNYELINY